MPSSRTPAMPTAAEDDQTNVDQVSVAEVAQRDTIAIHVLSVSATMIGVCLTVIGILRVAAKNNLAGSLADDFVAVDAILFLAAALTAYGALRSRRIATRQRIERWADVLFVLALGVMTLVCGIVTWTVL